MSAFVAISPVLASASEGSVAFFCKGCDAPHIIHIGQGSGERWSFNGNYDRPTFSPSVLVTWAPGRVCHSFITDGRIQYLDDSFHEIAGQTVDLARWTENWETW